MQSAGEGLSGDTFGVYLWVEEFPPGWECVAVCDGAERVRGHVIAYQEAKRGKVKLRVDRAPRAGRPDATACGYCGRPHWGICTTDGQGNPSA